MKVEKKKDLHENKNHKSTKKITKTFTTFYIYVFCSLTENIYRLNFIDQVNLHSYLK